MPKDSSVAEGPDVAEQSGPATLTTESLLIAMDGTWNSIPALRAGSMLSRHRGLAPRVITILEPSATAAFPHAPAVLVNAWPPDAECAERVRRVREQVAGCAADGGNWPILVEVGNPSEAIAWAALRDNVGLVAMGLRAHPRLDRLIGRETVLQVVRQVNVPVIAVTPDLETLPRRVLVAMDFSRSSIRAARTALQLVGPGATVTLAYVRPPANFGSEVAEGAGVIMQQGIAASFARLRRILEAPPGVELRPMVLDGRPGDALLAAATEMGADLIAAGRHRRDFLDRLRIGSVATQLIRAAQCSVLVTPPGAASIARRATPASGPDVAA